MTHILLTGAGFTYNWGGWLASEAFEYLLGCPDVDEALRDELWRDKNRGLGFESTLARLQQEAAIQPSRKAQVDRLTTALGGMFNTMDTGLKDRPFEFQDDPFEREDDSPYELAPFLAKFDAIFTLNQDLLLERHYAVKLERLRARQRWLGFDSPGIAPAAAPQGRYRHEYVAAKRIPKLREHFSIEKNIQPYFKLHGSQNWYDAAGGRLLVMGGNKTSAIQEQAILRWYAEQFDWYLNQGSARLMVIGYSFGDPHINASIIRAARRGLRVFIIDPRGSDVLDQRTGQIKVATDELMGAVQPVLIGASRRPLTATFGGDVVEYERVSTFFNW